MPATPKAEENFVGVADDTAPASSSPRNDETASDDLKAAKQSGAPTEVKQDEADEDANEGEATEDAKKDAEIKDAKLDEDHITLDITKDGKQGTDDDGKADDVSHEEQFKKNTGMTPRMCYRLVLISMTLRVMGGCWLAMVAIEYTRYYVINDLARFDVLRTLTGSPQYAVQAFLFPFLGVVSDRVSRKWLIAGASLASCASAWLLTLIPSVEVYIITKVLSLLSDVGAPVREAMLRDIFSAKEWETSAGGVTGLRSRMAVIAQMGFGVAMAVGMGLMKLGELGVGLPNEYTVHKEQCSAEHCVQPGHFSWEGHWAVDGNLRLMMILGSVTLSIDVLLTLFLFPETLQQDERISIRKLVKENWQVLAPWNNLRVFATPLLREMFTIRCIGYLVAAGGGSIFMSFYSRFEFDTFTMMLHTVLAGSATWFATLAVTKLVDRYGDMRGVWLPGNVLTMLSAISCALMPPGYGWMVFITWPTLAGPSFALQGFSADLMAKMLPPTVQGTFQTAKSFAMRLSMAIFMWPWNQLFVHTKELPYPLDATPMWASVACAGVMLVLTVRLLRRDPREAINNGQALDAFMASEYANSSWYRMHAAKDETDAPALPTNSTAGKTMPFEIIASAAKLRRQESLASVVSRASGGADAVRVEKSLQEACGVTVSL